MKKNCVILLLITLLMSCAQNNNEHDETLKSDAFKDKIGEKIAKKMPNYPGFGDKEQKILAKDIVDIIASELNKTKKKIITENLY